MGGTAKIAAASLASALLVCGAFIFQPRARRSEPRRDLHATMLYLLGFDYRRLNYPYQGLDQKLTGVKPARIVSEILA